ncbi:MAG: MBL fold metallo-hydrolase [Candidatus Bathyarchaeia archaeon]
MNITFHGGAREVGGSSIILETSYCKVALDYGIKVEEGPRNNLPKELDAVIVTHAHLDHSGNLLTLADERVSTIGSSATRDIVSDLLLDLLKVHRLNGKPLPYTTHDVDKINRSWITQEQVGLPGMEIRLCPAGHVMGARMAHIKADGRSLLYTGDFCLHDTEILDGADIYTLPKEPDIMIMESTYGGIRRPSRDELVRELLKSILEAQERGGNILIPTFAFHRMQEMVRRIDLAIQEGLLLKYNAYYLSGLGEKITAYFNEHTEFLGKMVQDDPAPFRYSYVRHLKRAEQIREPALVICTAGFGHAGFSRKLLFDWISDEDNAVIVSSGYIPKESPLSDAMEKDSIEDEGEKYPVRACVRQIELSGHADQNELVEFVRRIRPEKTFLVHGDMQHAEALKELLDPVTEVYIPSNGEQFTA